MIRPYTYERNKNVDAFQDTPASGYAPLSSKERRYFTDQYTALTPYKAPGPEYKAAGGPVELHVAAGHRGVDLGRGDVAERQFEFADGAELRHLMDARADAGAGIAGAADRQQDVAADAGGNRRRRGLDRGYARRAAHRRGGGKAQVGDAEIGDEVLGDGGAGGDRDHAVDVARAEASVGDGGQRGLHLERQGAAVLQAAAVGGFADAGDGGFFEEGHGSDAPEKVFFL